MSTEKETRHQIIDKMLLLSGWDVNDPTKVIEEFNIGVQPGAKAGTSEPDPSCQEHEYSDYVLLGRDGKPLAVVEAKKTFRDAELGREQARQYCYHREL